MDSMTSLIALFLLVLSATPAYATDYTVGDSSGWTSGSDYSTWATGKKFNAGDTLLFSYSMLHSVSEVSKSDYGSCSAANSVQTYTDGSTTIKLDKPGTRYFICGTSGHCSAGMKLAVNIGSGSGSAPAPSNSNSPSAGPGAADAPSTGPGADDTPSTGTDNGSGATSSSAPPASTTPAVTDTPATRSTTSPSSKTTPTTSTNAAAGSGFRAAGGLMAGVTGLVGLALMG